MQKKGNRKIKIIQNTKDFLYRIVEKREEKNIMKGSIWQM